MEHLNNPDYFLEEIKRTLKPDGYVVLTTSNLAALHYRVELFFGIQPRVLHPSLPAQKRMGCPDKYNGHKAVFTYRYAREVLLAHDFVIEKSGTHTIYPLPVGVSNLITRFFPNIGTYSYFKLRKKDRLTH